MIVATVPKKSSQNGVIDSTLKTKGLAFLTLFVEKGPKSRHFYQPAVNHRNLSPDNWYSERVGADGGATQPMMESMRSKVASDALAVGDAAVVFAHSMKKHTESKAPADVLKYRTTMDLEMKTNVDEDGELSDASEQCDLLSHAHCCWFIA